MIKRYLRLQKLIKDNKVIGTTIRSNCKACGNNTYYVAYIKNNNSNGIYCSKCGTCLKFENTNKSIYKSF